MRRAATILGLIALLAPAGAGACPVCTGTTRDRNANAFAGTTALLSLLPLTLFAGGIWWLRRSGFGGGEFVDRDEQKPDGEDRA